MDNKTVRVLVSVVLNIIVVTAGIFLIVTAATKAYTFGYDIFCEQSIDTVENTRQTEVTIPDKVSSKELAKIIYDNGLVKDETIFYFQIILSDHKDDFVGGTYTLNTGMKPTEIMEALTLQEQEE